MRQSLELNSGLNGLKIVKINQLSGLVVRASALRLGGRGFDPYQRPVKMVPNSFLLGAQHQGLDWGAL